MVPTGIGEYHGHARIHGEQVDAPCFEFREFAILRGLGVDGARKWSEEFVIERREAQAVVIGWRMLQGTGEPQLITRIDARVFHHRFL
jgi:hypothetical protein